MIDVLKKKKIPEPGQIVEVRGLRYTVTNVQYTATYEQRGTGRHFVSLTCIEDESLGQELQVFWDLEIGARLYQLREFPYPRGFDTPKKLEAFLDAVRWGTSSRTDLRNIQSPFRSAIEIEDYQLDPVIRAVQMPRVNLLIADDVGLGKTIEAGLVAQELIIRQKVRTIIIVCPSALQIQWQEQMRDKFGLDFPIVNSEFMKWLRRRRGIHVNPWTHFPRLITSIDYIKRDQPLRLIQSVLPQAGESIYPRRFDLLIVDEAHNIAPSGTGNYAIDSQRTRAIRLLVPHFEHKLFLTATPHNGYPESFTALLELLDSQRFARGVTPDHQQLHQVMVRRLKRELPPKWDGTPRFPKRHLEAIPVAYSELEKQAHIRLHTYTKLRQRHLEDVVVSTATEFVIKLLKKRLFSSPAAFLTTLEQHRHTLAGIATNPQRSKPKLSILRKQLEELTEEFASDEVSELCTSEAIATTTSCLTPLSPEEAEIIDFLHNWAVEASRQPDSKAVKLLHWLNHHPEQRVIIFTEYRTTQKWLYELLTNEGLAKGERLMTLYGGMKSEEREKIKAAFQASPELAPVRILLATDAASEGLDLQNHCAHLIHYEIPWNPNRLEQRNGRIDRHGQKAEQVNIYHFVDQDYSHQKPPTRPGDLGGDLEFLFRAVQKVDHIREDLGKVGPVIASQVEEAMLGKRLFLETSLAEAESEPVRKLLTFERKIKEQIEKFKEQLYETRLNLRFTPENIQSVVQIGLELANQLPLEPVPETPGVYNLPELKGSWNAAHQGLAHPHTGEIRPIVFDPDLIKGRDDRVLIHLNHRLVQMCLKVLRIEVWSRQGHQQYLHKLHRVSGRVIPPGISEFPAVIVHGRLLILGGNYQNLHEEVITAGGILKEGKYSSLNVSEVEKLLEHASLDPLPLNLQQRLASLWDVYYHPLRRSLEKRMSDRLKSLDNSLTKLCETEIKKITTVLTELQNAIAKELQQAQQPQQLELFSLTEREQFERNRSSLTARLAEIPAEIEQETQLIRQRFAEPTPRLFPLAITYLVPKNLV